MNVATLDLLARARRMNQSDIARLSGVSRQAVSKWFKAAGGHVDIRSGHLEKLAAGLGVPMECMLHELPGLDPSSRVRLETQLNWDHAFADLGAFLADAVRGNEKAVARLVEAFGLYQAAKL